MSNNHSVLVHLDTLVLDNRTINRSEHEYGKTVPNFWCLILEICQISSSGSLAPVVINPTGVSQVNAVDNEGYPSPIEQI
ncbi:hypothetical protein L2729_07220 [Shewanella gelidimarina]|uniref:hypothetical protein n=1 Tax=Shewanella gelidimarina TaxID=56813 RepID=UPI00200DF0FA|nr:hypothetical protein [Shewanella gelidimarina]MCL1057792.1 hypothetical protein [Shewanella gelidimarina]